MKIIGIIALIFGAVLLFQGISRRDSFAGHAASATSDLANSIDGGSRTPLHVTYIAIGGILVIAGAYVGFKRSSL